MTLSPKILSSLLLATVPLSANAESPVLMGNQFASLHQICGQHIDIGITTMNESDGTHTLISLPNHVTGQRDVFVSMMPVENGKQYSEYHLATFDTLSHRFIPRTDSPLSLVWGAAFSTDTGLSWHLALGSHVYDCKTMMPYKDDTTDKLYGEDENDKPATTDAALTYGESSPPGPLMMPASTTRHGDANKPEATGVPDNASPELSTSVPDTQTQETSHAEALPPPAPEGGAAPASAPSLPTAVTAGAPETPSGIPPKTATPAALSHGKKHPQQK